MPIYTYRCDPCELDFEQQLPLARYDEPQPCPTCTLIARKTVTQISFTLKGDGWAGKANRVKGQMAEKNQRLDAKTAEMKGDGAGVKLVPNVGGERTDTWKEAGKLAASKGKDPTGYNKLSKG